MLKAAPMRENVEHGTPPERMKYCTLTRLAEKLEWSKDKLYGYIYRYNNSHPNGQIDLFRIPGKGRCIHLKREDSEMLLAVLTHPEEYAEKVTRKPKR